VLCVGREICSHRVLVFVHDQETPMRYSIGLLLFLITTPLFAQSSEEFHFWPREQVGALPAELERRYREATDPLVRERGVTNERLLLRGDDGLHSMVVVHRSITGPAELHDTVADVYVVLSGKGIVHVGGTMVDRSELPDQPGEWRSPDVEGGEERPLAEGDVVNIPAGMVHWVKPASGQTITYLIVKVYKDEK